MPKVRSGRTVGGMVDPSLQRPLEDGSPEEWTEFDVLAANAATGARVAMWLRKQLPAARVVSAPDAAPSGDRDHPHRLRCAARVLGETAARTAAQVGSVLTRLELISQPERVTVVFHDVAGRHAA
jgi:hypothetical protein